MKAKKLFLLFVVLLTINFTGYSQDSKSKKIQPKRTVIEGVVKDFSNASKVLVINYCDPLSDERQFAQNLVETDGHFHAEHEYIFPQNLTIRFANKFVNIFVVPGDSLFVSIDAKKIGNDITNAIKFSGKNAELNRELFLWTTAQYSAFNSKFDESASPSVFIESVRKDFNSAKDSIESYSERSTISDFVKKWAFIDHKFLAANNLQEYSHPQADNWSVFTDPIFDVFNEDNFQTMYFQYHLQVCMGALINGNAEISQLFSDNKYAAAILLTIQELSRKAPQGVVRDVMLFSFLQEILTGMPELYGSVPEIKTAFSQDYFNEMLERKTNDRLKASEHLKIEKIEKQLDGVIYLNGGEAEKLPDVQLLNYLSEKYPNKVLYLDVWATWCGPCIEAFKYTPNLHKYFTGKDVVFINLCLESQQENWQKAIVRNNISGENYFLENNAAQLFRVENNLPGFPSYLIIDKKGGVLNPAPNPKNLESVIKKIESNL